MFSQVSVCQGEVCVAKGGAQGRGMRGGTGGRVQAGETATAADATHPTGMHSCSILFSFQYYSMLFNCFSEVWLRVQESCASLKTCSGSWCLIRCAQSLIRKTSLSGIKRGNIGEKVKLEAGIRMPLYHSDKISLFLSF